MILEFVNEKHERIDFICRRKLLNAKEVGQIFFLLFFFLKHKDFDDGLELKTVIIKLIY